MITKYEEKMTANDYAKSLIVDKFGELLDGYWAENNYDIYDYDGNRIMTEKEEVAIRMMLAKRIKGLTKYLGWTLPRVDEILNSEHNF